MTTTTNLDELIAAERKKTSYRIAKLKREAAAEQRRVDTRVVKLLRVQQPDVYDRLVSEAHLALTQDRSERSRKARRAVSSAPAEVATDEELPVGGYEEVRPSWNG